MKELLKQLPAVDELLKEHGTKQWLEAYPRVLVLEAIRTAIDARRRAVLKTADKNSAGSIDNAFFSLFKPL
jgi:hypothetical protein